jgi:hypothetical protein
MAYTDFEKCLLVHSRVEKVLEYEKCSGKLHSALAQLLEALAAKAFDLDLDGALHDFEADADAEFSGGDLDGSGQ